jgi:DNA polymerase III alpha subunit
MGFYHPATIVKDAQRHGLKILPIDVTKSDWLCTLEPVVARPSSVIDPRWLAVGQAISSQPSAIRQETVFPSREKTSDPGVAFEGQGFRRAVEVSHSSGALAVEVDEKAAIRQNSIAISWEEIGSYTRPRSGPAFASVAQRQRNEAYNPPTPSSLPSHSSAAFQAVSDTKNIREPGCRGGEKQPELALRLGLKYVRGLREAAAQALAHERRLSPFQSIHDLTRRVPELRRDELTTLAEIGALNSVSSCELQVSDVPNTLSTRLHSKPEIPHRQSDTGKAKLTRRDALWQVGKAVRLSGPLLEEFPEPDFPSPLAPMTHEERLVADFHGTGLTVGPHPMAYRRAEMTALGIRPAAELKSIPSGQRLRIGGCVIARQRPGTAKGFVFLSLEDETGIANAIVTPGLLQKNRVLLISERFLMVEGILQNLDNVISVKAERVLPLFVTRAETSSHDFH